ncbi:receptor-type tyrosine-protein phosphatase epsilon-like [Saccostrea cucullata]|uniref:receptor-type tyrosine-protein phosphatase epsilon-like n=1 Tax=Saccostrea cuccullata TaxID=36930 RepID=UPI002ED42058
MNKYGPGCNLSCGYCLNTTCHHINGTCPYGCSNGYVNLNCTTKCSPGKYGFQCMDNCRETCMNNICDPVNGNCDEVKDTLLGGSNDDNIGLIVGGIAGLVIAILVIVIVVVVFKRRSVRKTERKGGLEKGASSSEKRMLGTGFGSIGSEPEPPFSRENTYLETDDEKRSKQQKKSDDHEVDVDDDEKIHSENPYGDFYANEPMIREIPLNQLESVIAENRKNGDDGFKKEYATLPYGEIYKCDAGKSEENMIKNRFKTTFPYDHSRVILKSETGSDYINANYIEGAEKDKEYIATQGPRQNTVVDFWTMIWQEHVEAIVILTNLKEGTKTKCTQYWPGPNKHTSYGCLSVKMVEEKEYAFYIIRKFTIFHKETKNKRHVTQYHYTAWPDHGTPDPLCLVIFLDHVTRTVYNQKHSPTVVHCSAGIGRTGTYIAIDVLNKKARKTGKVNIAEYVKKMRESRMNMVQTYEQYMTIFLALNEIFKSPVKSITVDEFTKKAETLTTDKVANQSALQKEFQRLMNIRPKYDDTAFKIAKDGCGDIYFNGILPLDKYSIHLSSVVPKRGNFINAVIVPSHTNDIAFIVTQYPAEEDAVDFLRLLSDHESDTVVCMDPLNKISSSKAWFPCLTPSSKTVNPFTVQFQSKSETDVNTTIVHIRQENREKKVQPVTIIEPKVDIKTSGTPLDTSQLRSLVSATLRTETENPITIVSSDGAVLCGVFCAVHNAIQQIKMDNSVDVFTAVRQLQVRRPEFCSNIGEYRFVIKAVCDHIQSSSESIYCNQ